MRTILIISFAFLLSACSTFSPQGYGDIKRLEIVNKVYRDLRKPISIENPEIRNKPIPLRVK